MSITEARALADEALANFKRNGTDRTKATWDVTYALGKLLAALPETPRPQDISTDDRHDSDCATHNEPAYPNGPCDCRLSDHEAVRQAVADAIDDAAVITPRNEFLGGSTIANLAEVADAVLKLLPAATRRPSPPTEEQVLAAMEAWSSEPVSLPGETSETSARRYMRAASKAAARVGGDGDD